MSDMQRDELYERLDRLDEDASLLFDDDRRFRMVIVGGSALILLETIFRATHDIDALDASPELSGLLSRYDINRNVAAYAGNFAYNYEDRLVSLPVGGRKIDFFSASLEDIVAAKLFSERPSDRQDILSPSVLEALDWKLLEKIATAEDEIKASALSERSYINFIENYNEYVRRFGPCGS